MKKEIHLLCGDLLEKKRKDQNLELKALSDSAASDTKSSMGDKYETGREMINLEKSKIAEQISNTAKMILALNSIDLEKKMSVGQLGALISTESNHYYVSVSLGELNLNGEQVYAVSPVSPIGRSLLNKKIGDSFNMGPKSFEIIAIE